MSEHPLSDQAEQEEVNANLPAMDLTSRIEALLFVASEPASMYHLAQALEVSEGEVEGALDQLAEQCRNRGLRLQRNDRRVQFVTAPKAAEDVRRFLGLDDSSRLSTAALETLALVAYRQPITRAEMESVRGVNCDSVLRTLLSHGLVAALGRLDQVGRPIVYGTTFEFLQYFGLSDLCELPAWADVAVSRGRHLDEPGREAHKGEEI
jgi:segregation and condensation protein B